MVSERRAAAIQRRKNKRLKASDGTKKTVKDNAGTWVSPDSLIQEAIDKHEHLKNAYPMERVIQVYPDGVLKGTQSQVQRITGEMSKCSVSLGIARFVLSLFLNWAANWDDCTQHLFEWRFHVHVLFKIFEPSRVRMMKDGLTEEFPHANEPISQFLDLLRIPDSIFVLVEKGISTRHYQLICSEYKKSAEENILRNFNARLERHICARLEVKLWSYQDHSSFGGLETFLKKLENLSRTIIQICNWTLVLNAEKRLRAYCNRKNVAISIWYAEILRVFLDVRAIILESKETFARPILWKLIVSRKIRQRDEAMRESKTTALAGVQTALQQARGNRDLSNEIFHGAMRPGFYSVGKAFSLMSMSKLRGCYITLDQNLLSPLVRRAVPGMKKPKPWIWYDIAFQFHERKWVPRKSQCVQGDRQHWSQSTVLGPISLPKNVRTGISACARTPEMLTNDIDELQDTFSNVESPSQHVVSTIQTNGYDFKVHLVRPCDDDPSSNVHTPTIGRDELREIGYTAIKGVFDPLRDKSGVFRSVEKCQTNGKKYTVSGVDPGGVKFLSSVQAVTTIGMPFNTRMFVPGCEVSSTTYRKDALLSYSNSIERERRFVQDIRTPYGDAVADSSQFSLKNRAQSNASIITTGFHFEALVSELVTFEDFFDRRRHRSNLSRARAKAIDKLANVLMKKPGDGSQRIVAFGDGQFGHTRYGPLPRKDFLRSCALRGVVVLIDEYKTTQMCSRCGAKLIKNTVTRVFRCASETCRDREVDRDINAAENIGSILICKLNGRQAPVHLRRKK